MPHYAALLRDGEIVQVEAQKLLDIAVQHRSIKKVYGVKNETYLKALLVEAMANPLREFSPAVFARKFDIRQGIVRKWMDDPEIDKAVKMRAKEALGGGVALSRIYKKVYRQAVAGHFKQQKIVLEMTGQYTPGLKVEHDVTTVESKFRELERQRKLNESKFVPSNSDESS